MKQSLIGLLFIANICTSQIPNGYYNSAAGLNSNSLKIALHNIIKNHTIVSYNNLWNAYKKTDIKANSKVWDIYSDVPGANSPYQYSFVTDQCGNYSTEGDCYNREHSWPQSWFNSLSGPVSDLFHIYPTDGKVNGVRNNYPYGNVSIASWTSMNGGKLGLCTNAGYSQTVFEPIDAYKGDLARGYFYMSTRYYNEDSGWGSSDATNKSIILPWQLNVLLQWHHQDPVSTKEIARNDSIYYKFQNNRNPFIDNPQWADSIWKNTIITFLQKEVSKPLVNLYPNPASELFTVTINNSSNDNYVLRITDITGKILKEDDGFIHSKTIVCSNWEKGLYFIRLYNDNVSINYKLIKE